MGDVIRKTEAGMRRYGPMANPLAVLARHELEAYTRALAAEVERLRPFETLIRGAGVVLDDSRLRYVEIQVDRDSFLAARPEDGGERITHGRHCTCSACAREDWTQTHLAPCGMHGPSCPRVYAPLGGAGTYVARSEDGDA